MSNNEFGDPRKKLLMEDLTRLENEYKKLYRFVEQCNENVDKGNDMVKETNLKIDSTNRNLDKILQVLTGNDLDETDTGMIGQVKELEGRIIKLERFRDRAIYIMIGLSFGGGWAISDIIDKFFSK